MQISCQFNYSVFSILYWNKCFFRSDSVDDIIFNCWPNNYIRWFVSTKCNNFFDYPFYHYLYWNEFILLFIVNIRSFYKRIDSFRRIQIFRFKIPCDTFNGNYNFRFCFRQLFCINFRVSNIWFDYYVILYVSRYQ